MGVEAVPFRSWKFLVALESAGVCRKVFQLQFERGVGLFVHLSYFTHTHGLLGRYTHNGPPGSSGNIELQEGGITTTRRVKYAHHLSGEAHFSQTNQVKTLVRKQAAPLADASGHMFTVQLGGLEHFNELAERDHQSPSSNRTTLTFRMGELGAVPVRFVGRWFHSSSIEIVGRGKLPVDRPNPVGLMSKDGTVVGGFLLAPPDGSLGEEFRIALACVPMPELNWSGQPFLLCLGGFDHGEAINDEQSGFITVHYTDRTETFDNLQKMLGTIDLGE